MNKYEVSLTSGKTSYVEADSIAVEGGVILFYNANGDLRKAYSAHNFEEIEQA